METKEERIARRHRERDEQMKASPGYVTFSIMFTLAYPFIAVFTFRHVDTPGVLFRYFAGSGVGC